MGKRDDDSKAKQAWALFDEVVARAAPDGVYSNPWDGETYVPHIETLEELLGCALSVVPDPAETRSGVAAKALDAWLAYELRRAGFAPDAVWPRASHPRVIPTDITLLLEGLPRTTERPKLRARLEGANAPKGVVSADANILGKNYVKQVDVVMSSWATGPEILISTKRMDGSYGKNAANRIEEANGDAKNLRGRHPMAALGFLFGLRSEAFDVEPATARWLVDQLQKLNREDDAYEAVCLIVPEYTVALPAKTAGSDDDAEPDNALLEPGADELEDSEAPAPILDLDARLAALPTVKVREDLTPRDLRPAAFLAAIVNYVLDAAPVTMHREARVRAGRPYVDPPERKSRKKATDDGPSDLSES